MEQEVRERRRPGAGVTLKVLGFALLAVALLNGMFLMKSGVEDGEHFNVALTAAGAVLYGLGMWRSRRND